ncbi:MAG: hypothetical protein QOH10_522 [Actinomycetota bacterium]|nr:hypothetical protein [Actinomycetota bacterium]
MPVDSDALAARVFRVTLGLLAIALLVALAIGGRSQHHALGDVPGRLIAHHIHAGELPYIGWRTEYPVVVGIAQWVASWVGGSPLGFLLATSALSTGLALLLARMLVRASGVNVWHAVLAPAFVLYALHNWDLFAVVPAVAGVLAFDEGRDRWSGALIAVGACAKVFPAVFLPPLVARRVHDDGWRAALPLVTGAGITTIALNLPFIVGSGRGWAYPFRFQSRRSITWGTLWSVAGRLPAVGRHLQIHTGATANALSLSALIVGVAVLCVLGARRQMSAVAIGAAATGIFLLVNKVYSPNYDLWLVPWLALLPLARRWRVTLGCFTTAVFVVVFGYFHGVVGHSVLRATLPFLVVGRAAAIAALIATAVGLTRAGRSGVLQRATPPATVRAPTASEEP